jgi:hypothetical protein
METWILAAILKPFAMFILFGVIGLGIRHFINETMPECKAKDVLLKHRGGPKDSMCR